MDALGLPQASRAPRRPRGSRRADAGRRRSASRPHGSSGGARARKERGCRRSAPPPRSHRAGAHRTPRHERGRGETRRCARPPPGRTSPRCRPPTGSPGSQTRCSRPRRSAPRRADANAPAPPTSPRPTSASCPAMSLERQPARAAVAIRAVRLDVPPSGFLGNTVGEVPHNGLLRPEFDADGDLDDVSVKYRRERADDGRSAGHIPMIAGPRLARRRRKSCTSGASESTRRGRCPVRLRSTAEPGSEGDHHQREQREKSDRKAEARIAPTRAAMGDLP